MEHFLQCNYCWAEISMILDTSVENQSYIEDCEVCCRPIEVEMTFRNGELASFNNRSIEQ